MRFGSVTPEFTRLECVQQASIITGVTLTTFARGRRSVLNFDSLPFARWRHCYAERATR